MKTKAGIPSRIKHVLVMAGLVVLTGPGVFAGAGRDHHSDGTHHSVEETGCCTCSSRRLAVFAAVHTVMSPLPNLDSYYFQVTWNYRELPDFTAGGFQVQSWNGDNDLDFQNVGERVEPKRRADLLDQVLETTRHPDRLFHRERHVADLGPVRPPGDDLIHDGSFCDLNQYSPAVSIGNSWITYGDNRVKLLVLQRVRYYGASGR